MAVDHNNPQSRNEEILIATIDGNEYNKAPQSRMEELLLELKETIEEGGGGGGTTNYENLSNQPQINGETLIGNKTGAELGLVDAEEGKGLSTNDYDDNEKAAVAAATSAISAIKDGTDLDSFGDVEVALLDKADTSDLGTAAAKDSTNAVTAGSTDLVESGAVKDAIDAAVAAAYHHAGTKTVAQLTHDLLIAANEGNVYNITDSGTTTSDFIEGIGKTINEGSNVGICKVGNTYMFDLLSGFVDTSNFVQKSVTAGLLKNDGTVNDEIEGDVDSLKSGFTALDNEVNGDATAYPYADVITIEDAVPANVADCSVKIEPVQDLHGYDKPWVGGAGKNKCAGTYTTTTNGGVTFTANSDGTVSATDTSSGYAYVNSSEFTIKAGTYIFSGAPSGNSKYVLAIYSGATLISQISNGTETGVTFESDTNIVVRCVVNGANITTGVTYKPMIRLATESDDTWEPWSNICPITQYDSCKITRIGKNWFNINKSFTNNIVDHVTNDGYIVTKANAPVGWSQVGTFIAKKNVKYTLSVTNGFGGYCARIALGTSSSVSPSTSNLASLPKTNLTVNEVTQIVDPTHSSKTFTSNEDQTIYLWICTDRNNTGSFASTTFALQIERSETATSYEPYAGKTYTIALGDTIYGGTVDFDSGVMTVDRAVIEYDGSNDENWLLDEGTHNFFYIELTGRNSSMAVIANNCVNASISKTTTDLGVGTDARYLRYRYANDNSLTVSDLKTFLASNNLQVCYYIATPTTIQLTPQQIQLLKGTNTLTASTGQISVTVNGVSGAIGAVQEQVNDIAEDVALKQNATDNNLQTTDKTIVGGINEVKSGLTNITKNDGGVSVDISAYTSSNPYSATHDGYVVVSSERSTSGVIQVFTMGANNNLSLGSIGMNVTGLYQIESMYVRKGMRVYVNSNTASGSTVSFIPII